MEWKDVIDFWFEEVKPKQKWKKDLKFDALIREKFENTFWDVVKGKYEDWRMEPEGRLAEVVVLDQFSRNIFRDKPEAFAHDSLALKLAEEAVRVGDDRRLDGKKRSALYMPYMHSESADVHEEGMKLFGSLNDDMGIKYMKSHKKIIDEFGRYPHRNEILGRKSTEEELKHIREHGGF